MGRLNRFAYLVRAKGFVGALSDAWSWFRWKLRGSQVPRAPVSAADWVRVHELLRPTNPQPNVRFSVVVPVYNTPPDLLAACVDSVLRQSHANWELLLVDDASTNTATTSELATLAAADSRIRVIRRDSNGGISSATNTGIDASSGDYVAFVDHDDVLVETALEWVSSCCPVADLIYTDEAKIDGSGEISDRVLKPSWSPRLLLSHNYVSHFAVIRRSLLDRLGGLSDTFDGAQDHDLMLRVSEESVTVAHVPSVLYLWRRTAGSTSDDPASKPYAERAGLAAVQAAIDRRGWDATSAIGRGVPFRYAVTWRQAVEDLPDIKVIIPTRDRVDLLRRAVVGVLQRTDGVNIHLVIVDNGSESVDTLAYLREIADRSDVTVVRVDDAFNFSRLCNIGAGAGPHCESLLFFNNDVEVVHRGWLSQMYGWFSDPEVVAVGTQLLYDDLETIQHGGVAIGAGHLGWHLSGGLSNEPRLGDPHDSAHEVTAVTAACMLVRTAAFDAVGGYEEILPTDFQDVDFCLKLRRQLGGTIVYEPMFPLMHQESASRGDTNAGNGFTMARMEFRWPGIRNSVDPYFHPFAAQPQLGRHEAMEIDDATIKLLDPRITTSTTLDARVATGDEYGEKSTDSE